MLLKDYLAENTLTGNRLDEYLEPVPSNYFSLEDQLLVKMICLMKIQKDLWSWKIKEYMVMML